MTRYVAAGALTALTWHYLETTGLLVPFVIAVAAVSLLTHRHWTRL